MSQVTCHQVYHLVMNVCYHPYLASSKGPLPICIVVISYNLLYIVCCYMSGGNFQRASSIHIQLTPLLGNVPTKSFPYLYGENSLAFASLGWVQHYA